MIVEKLEISKEG